MFNNFLSRGKIQNSPSEVFNAEISPEKVK